MCIVYFCKRHINCTYMYLQCKGMALLPIDKLISLREHYGIS